MNVLTIGDKKFSVEIAKQLKKHNVYAIVGEKLNLQIKKAFYKIKKDIILLPHKKLKNFSYFAGIQWGKIPPLNENLVNNMVHCESVVMKMYERIKSLNPDNYDKRKIHYLYSLRYWNWFLDHYKIEALLTYSIPHMGYDYIVYELCRLKGIKIYINYFLYPSWGYFMSNIYEPFQNFKPEEEREKYLYPALKNIFTEYLYNKPLSYKPVIIPNIARIKKHQEKVKIEQRNLWEFYSKCCISPNLKKKFIYAPLHYQYEGSTCPLGGIFVDQFFMIDILSRLGIQVYVKEHPHLSKNRSVAFYNQIHKLPNVNLIPIETNNYDLIKKSFCVATITGTAGWEASLKGKCTLLFGNIYYQYLPSVFQVKNVDDCLTAIEKIKEYKLDVNVMDSYLKGIENYLHPLTYNHIVAKFKEEIEK